MASGDTLLTVHPYKNEPPAANYATDGIRNGQPVLLFDGSVDQDAIFSDIMVRHYSAGGITAYLHASFTSALSGTSRWEISFERVTGNDKDADSFATAKSLTITPNGSSGIETIGSVAFTNGEIDSIVAGDHYRVRVRRTPTDAADDVPTDAELGAMELKET